MNHTSARHHLGTGLYWTFVALLAVALGLGAGLGLAPASVWADEPVAILNTLGAATPTTQFDFGGTGGISILPTFFSGPQFTLAEPMVIVEIGGFVNEPAANPPFGVQIRPSLNGFPDPATVIASFTLSDDNDYSVVSYESAAMSLSLPPGTYFALFTSQGPDPGYEMQFATEPFAYRPESVVLGLYYPLSGAVSSTGEPVPGGFRILGLPVTGALAVDIDIKPGSELNPINPKSRGTLPVAILSSATFSAPGQVDTASLTFGATGDEPSLAFCSGAADVNGDGRLDVVCHFRTRWTGFQAGDTQGYLKGQTVDGRPLEGSDSVRIVP